jgi:hypothetical protein
MEEFLDGEVVFDESIHDEIADAIGVFGPGVDVDFFGVGA